MIYRFNLFFNYLELFKVNLDVLFGVKEIWVKVGEFLIIFIGIFGVFIFICIWNKNGFFVDSRVSYFLD